MVGGGGWWWWCSQRLLCLNPNTVLVVLLLGLWLWLLLGCHNYSILRLKCTSLLDRVAGRLAGRVLEEMELEPTQPPTAVEVGLAELSKNSKTL